MTTTVDFSQRVREVLNRNNIQLRSLDLLQEGIRKRFLQERHKAILVIRNRVFEREIDALDQQTIDVFDTTLQAHLKAGQLVLVVLPTEERIRYILQTGVKNIYGDRIRLVVRDPRKNRRYRLASDPPVRVRLVPDVLALKIQTGEVHLLRSVSGLAAEELVPGHAEEGAGAEPETEAVGTMPREEDSSQGGVLAVDGMEAVVRDRLAHPESGKGAVEQAELDAIAIMPATASDISIGGMCLRCPAARGRTGPDQIVAVESVMRNEDQKGHRLFDFQIFAVVRNVEERNGQFYLHLQFLANLPETAMIFFP